MGSEGRERLTLVFWVQRLSIWVNGEDGEKKEKARVLFGACHLFVMNDLVPGRILPFTVELLFPPVMGDLQFRFLVEVISDVMGGPPGDVTLAPCLSQSELVVVAYSR